MHDPAKYITFLLIWLIASAVEAQQPIVAAPHKPVEPRLSNPKPSPVASVPRSLVGGLWMADAASTASLVLNNDVETAPISVTPILYLSTGRRIALPSLTLNPSTVAVVSINDALRQAGLDLTKPLFGYAEVQYTWPWDGLCASIRNLDTAHSLIFVYTLEPLHEIVQGHLISNVAALQENLLEGIWWKQEPGVTGFVALSNVLDSPAHASISVSDEDSTPFKTHSLTIPGHSTSLVHLDEVEATNEAQGGIRISYDGPSNGLKINGGLEDRAVGYSAHLPLHFPPVASAPQTVLSTAALGLMTGISDPMMSFPSGTVFTPYSVVRNISGQAVTLTPTLWWMEGVVPRSRQLSKVTLLPYQTRNLNVPALLTKAGLVDYAGSFNLVLDSDGKSRALLEAAGSVDRNNTYVFEVTPEATMESVFKSLSYWSTANGDDTMVSLWNPADEPQDFIFTLYFSGGDGHYSVPIHLNGRQAHTFNVSEIIHSGAPDVEGNVILASVHEGRAEIMGSQGENEHILLALDAGIYNVKKATCGGVGCKTCGGIINSWMSPNGFSLPVGSSEQLSCMGQYNTGAQFNYTSSSKWSSTNPPVASVSNGLTTADSPGSGGIVADDEGAADYSNNCGPNSDTVCPQTTGMQCQAPVSVASVTISGLSTVIVGNSIQLTASGNPSGGSYSWTSSNANVTLANSGTATVTVTGATVGSSTLTVTYTYTQGEITATPTATRTVSAVQPIPVNFTASAGVPSANGTLTFTYSFQSSTGNLSDLSSCQVGETVFYPGSSASYVWPAPMVQSTTNPTVLYGSGSSGGFTDHNYPPNSFAKPYSADSFSATQRLQWECPYYANGSYQKFVPDITITRSVSQTANGSWQYTITKSGSSNTAKLP